MQQTQMFQHMDAHHHYQVGRQQQLIWELAAQYREQQRRLVQQVATLLSPQQASVNQEAGT